MTYLLDTNVCINYLKRPLSGIRQRLSSISDSEIAVNVSEFSRVVGLSWEDWED